MPLFTQCAVLLLLIVPSAISTAATVELVSIPGNTNTRTCPSQERKDEAIQHVRDSILTFKQDNNLTSRDVVYNLNCGSGEWHRVAHLNMSNSSQQCPSAWREYNNGTVRGCRRPETMSGTCPATFYTTRHQYSRVCGRAIGYQIGTTNAFGYHATGQIIDSYYVYGVSVTYGVPRRHIWTLASGLSQGSFISQGWDCPCIDPSNSGNVPPPSFVGDNYYCESGNPTSMDNITLFYPTDPLWDGQQCEGQCCSNGKSPPWFSVDLPNPTTDDIEVRICVPERSVDDIVLQLLELYVQ